MKKTAVATALLLIFACGRAEKPLESATDSAATTETSATAEATETTPPVTNTDTPAAIVARAGQPLPGDLPVDRLALWLDAGALVTTGQDNVVTEWRSPNNMRASQQTEGARPRLYGNAVGGKPGIRFDGDNDLLETNLNIDPKLMPNLTVVVVFNSRIAEPSPLRKLYGHDDGGYDRAAGLDDRGEGANYTIFAGSAGILPYFNLVPNQTYITVDSYTGNVFNGWVNGAPTLMGKEIGHDAGLPHFYIGGTGTIYNEPWSGDVAEVLVYMRALTDVERTKVENYLGNKYGVALAGR